MTKEEYSQLLNSDYWKGYSYSIIKERNFTCEDCGRRFYNERNKLQVHHLVYRDVKPWSYKPEELIVLCEECHKKRHGIVTTPQVNSIVNNTNGGYNKTYKYEKENDFLSDDNLRAILSTFLSFFLLLSALPIRLFKWAYRKNKVATIIGAFVFTLFIMAFFNSVEDENDASAPQTSKSSTESLYTPSFSNKEVPLKNEAVIANNDEEEQEMSTANEVKFNDDESTDLSVIPIQEMKPVQNTEETSEVKSEEHLSTLELLERKQHADVVKQAKRAGVSTEGSTLEILERIQHADVVKQAKRAGVSTEGSTLEILERINRKDLE